MLPSENPVVTWTVKVTWTESASSDHPTFVIVDGKVYHIDDGMTVTDTQHTVLFGTNQFFADGRKYSENWLGTGGTGFEEGNFCVEGVCRASSSYKY